MAQAPTLDSCPLGPTLCSLQGWFESKYMPLGLTAVKRVAEEEPEHADVFVGFPCAAA